MSLDLGKYLREKPVIALVGATNDSRKFGNVIMRDMQRKGFEMIPINPKATTVENAPAYPDLATAGAQHEIGLVVYVVPPSITLKGLAEAKELGLKRVWVQPGAADAAVREYLEENEFEALVDACVMVEAL